MERRGGGQGNSDDRTTRPSFFISGGQHPNCEEFRQNKERKPEHGQYLIIVHRSLLAIFSEGEALRGTFYSAWALFAATTYRVIKSSWSK